MSSGACVVCELASPFFKKNTFVALASQAWIFLNAAVVNLQRELFFAQEQQTKDLKSIQGHNNNCNHFFLKRVKALKYHWVVCIQQDANRNCWITLKQGFIMHVNQPAENCSCVKQAVIV